jgi:hypothetical protein
MVPPTIAVTLLFFFLGDGKFGFVAVQLAFIV